MCNQEISNIKTNKPLQKAPLDAQNNSINQFPGQIGAFVPSFERTRRNRAHLTKFTTCPIEFHYLHIGTHHLGMTQFCIRFLRTTDTQSIPVLESFESLRICLRLKVNVKPLRIQILIHLQFKIVIFTHQRSSRIGTRSPLLISLQKIRASHLPTNLTTFGEK